MLRIIVGSHNPVKKDAVLRAFNFVFPDEKFEISTHDAPSGVSDQPQSFLETKRGSYNRAVACKQQYPDANFYVGLEGGNEKIDNEYWMSAWFSVLDKDGKLGQAQAQAVKLPSAMNKLLDQGLELGFVCDQVLGGENNKQKGGTIAKLTDGKVTRVDYYMQGMVIALATFVRPDLY